MPTVGTLTVTITPASIAYANHATAAVSRLPQQFLTQPNIVAFLTAITGPCQDIENALFQLLTQRAISTSFGVQLDQIGDIVGQTRNGLNDLTYARYISARVSANRSRGAIEDLIAVARLIIGQPATPIVVSTESIATVVVTLGLVPTSAVVASALISFLNVTKTAGIHLILSTLSDTLANTFTCSLTSFLTGSVSAGGLVLTVDSTANYPTTGSIVVDVGGANPETVLYAVADATHFACSALTFAHASGARCDALAQPGKGWGDATETNQPTLVAYGATGPTGGAFSSAQDR